jgi:hypothetical protein
LAAAENTGADLSIRVQMAAVARADAALVAAKDDGGELPLLVDRTKVPAAAV